MVEQYRYSPTGIPFGLPRGDVDVADKAILVGQSGMSTGRGQFSKALVRNRVGYGLLATLTRDRYREQRQKTFHASLRRRFRSKALRHDGHGFRVLSITAIP